MNNNLITGDTKISTLNGTLLVLLYTIPDKEIIKSCILAGTAAAVSFIVSVMCKWIWSKIQGTPEDS